MTDVDSYQPPEVAGGTTYASTPGAPAEFSYGGGADGNTLNIMMGVVFMGYALLFTVMMMACVCNKPRSAAYAVNNGFTRFDLEATTEQQKTGPVAELDAMWRKAFIGKVNFPAGAKSGHHNTSCPARAGGRIGGHGGGWLSGARREC